MPASRRRAAVAAPVVLAALALPGAASAAVVSTTITDPAGDFSVLNPAKLKYPARSIDLERVTLSSDTSTGSKQLYVKVRLRNLIPSDPTANQQFSLFFSSGTQSIGPMYVSTVKPGVRGCRVCNLTRNPREDFFAVRIPASRLGNGRNLSVQVSGSYYARNLQRSSDDSRKTPGKNY